MCVVMTYEMDLGLDWEDVTDIGELFSFSQASIARDTHLDDFNIENDTCHSSAADNCHFIQCQECCFG